MSSKRANREIPACYAMVQPGLESIAADEIIERAWGRGQTHDAGIVFFDCLRSIPSILDLRTTEDVFLMAWGTTAVELPGERSAAFASGRARGELGNS